MPPSDRPVETPTTRMYAPHHNRVVRAIARRVFDFLPPGKCSTARVGRRRRR